MKALTRDEGELFEQAISNLDIDMLCEAAKETIKVVQKEIAIKEAEEKKKKESRTAVPGSGLVYCSLLDVSRQ